MTLSPTLSAGASPSDDPLLALHRDFWAWRVVQQPMSRDDIPRVERPAGKLQVLRFLAEARRAKG